MEQKQNLQIRLVGYTVDKISFLANKSFDFKTNKKVNITPRFDREVTKIDDQTFVLSLSISFDHPDNMIPFYLDLQISGTFIFTNWQTAQMVMISKNHATSVLYPYLRALVTTVTANANVPPYVLPIMNSSTLFKDKERKS